MNHSVSDIETWKSELVVLCRDYWICNFYPGTCTRPSKGKRQYEIFGQCNYLDIERVENLENVHKSSLKEA